MAIWGVNFTRNPNICQFVSDMLCGHPFIANSIAIVSGIDPDHLTAETGNLVFSVYGQHGVRLDLPLVDAQQIFT
jgi:hypothetical protein